MKCSDETCPICGEGTLTGQKGKNNVEYKGHIAELEVHYSVCDVCKSEQADATQLRANKRLMNAFKKKVDGLLSGSEVKALRVKLGLSQAEASLIFGGGPIAFSKYESDDVAQSEAMDKLLRLSSEVPEAFDRLCRKVGIQSGIAGKKWQGAQDWLSVVGEQPKTKRPNLRVISSNPIKSSEQQDKWAAVA